MHEEVIRALEDVVLSLDFLGAGIQKVLDINAKMEEDVVDVAEYEKAQKVLSALFKRQKVLVNRLSDKLMVCATLDKAFSIG